MLRLVVCSSRLGLWVLTTCACVGVALVFRVVHGPLAVILAPTRELAQQARCSCAVRCSWRGE